MQPALHQIVGSSSPGPAPSVTFTHFSAYDPIFNVPNLVNNTGGTSDPEVYITLLQGPLVSSASSYTLTKASGASYNYTEFQDLMDSLVTQAVGWGLTSGVDKTEVSYSGSIDRYRYEEGAIFSDLATGWYPTIEEILALEPATLVVSGARFVAEEGTRVGVGEFLTGTNGAVSVGGTTREFTESLPRVVFQVSYG